MGSDFSYQEAGKRHGDTIAYKDEDVLATVGKVPQHISKIRIWYSDYIVGFEVFYDTQSAGARMGSEYIHGT